MGRAPLSPSGNPLTKFVNLWQTPQERRDKYLLVRSYGLPYCDARRMRDWHMTKIELKLHNLGLVSQVSKLLFEEEDSILFDFSKD